MARSFLFLLISIFFICTLPSDSWAAELALRQANSGSNDEFALHWGARALVVRMRDCGLSPVYEEFDDGHMSIAYRYDVSLPLMARALSG